MNTPVREGETIEGSRTTRNRPYPVLKCSSTSYVRGERGTVALRHEARCTCQCCPGLLSARPMGGRCLCCCGMPHGCDWPAPRRVSSARRSDSGQRNSPGLNAQPGAPARARWRESWRMQRAAMLASPRANATVLAADSPPPAKEAQRRMRHRRRMAGWS